MCQPSHKILTSKEKASTTTLRILVSFLLLFFLFRERDARWLCLASQVRVRRALLRPPCLSPSLCGASSAVRKEGCLVAQSAAECCRCLRSTDKRETQPSHLHAGLRLWLPLLVGTCCFRFFNIVVGFFLPACTKCLQWTSAHTQ